MSSPGASAPQTNGPFLYQFLGIPPSWLNKRPKLPSRNWLIFLSFTFSVCGLYTYDRRKCKEIRQTYISNVQHLSEESLSSTSFPRKIFVYGSKCPGDEESDRTLQYFRRYVKPILVAAAVDYDIVKGKRHGSLAELVAEKIKSERRIDLGIDPPPVLETLGIPAHNREVERKRFMEGGILIIGRHTFKEFMHGLKRGWTEPLDVIDKESALSKELEDDGVFDDSLEPESNSQTAFRSPLLPPAGVYPSFRLQNEKVADNLPDPRVTEIPDRIHPYPPILLLHFRNLVGLKYIPMMIWEFFNRRKEVQRGAEAAYRLITGETRPIRGPLSEDEQTSPESDLSFDVDVEKYYKLGNLPADIEKARKSYYDGLRQKIKVARELARHEREPTKDERNYPPPTEVELRSERIQKELRWRSDLAGWEIINPNSPVAWDPRFADALSVYISEK